MKRKVLTIVMVAFCMVIALAVLAGCGDSSTTGEETSKVLSEADPAASADPAEQFVGSWTLAAAESQGVTMAGDFGEMIGMSDMGMLNLKDDGTGDMTMGDEEGDKVALTWKAVNDNTATLTPEEETDYTGESIDVTYKDGALFMTIEQDDQTATAIFTHDGKYAGAKVISMDNAKPITSEDELIGTWNMTAMNLMGISVYGDADSLKEMSGGTDMSITFKEGGKATMSSGDGTWTVDKDGAKLTGSDVMGTHTYPVKKQGDDIVIDMSESLGGTEFIVLLSK